MELVITDSGVSAFAIAALILVLYSYDDLRTRKVPNGFVFASVFIGLSMGILNGHLIEHAVLHLTAGFLSLILGYTLFRIGAFGGADVKALFTIAVISPGIEFANWGNPVLEGIIAVGLLLVITLLCAYIITQRKIEGTKPIPLIPILFGAYLVLQLLALF